MHPRLSQKFHGPCETSPETFSLIYGHIFFLRSTYDYSALQQSSSMAVREKDPLKHVRDFVDASKYFQHA